EREAKTALTLDRAAVLARVDGDEELLREVVALFLEDYPRVLAEVRDAIARGDAALLQRAAHTLKGSVGNFDAADCQEAALTLGLLGRSGHPPRGARVLKVVEGPLEALRRALAALVPATSG